MLLRPEGLLPIEVARRELHSAEELLEIPDEELLPLDTLAAEAAEARRPWSRRVGRSSTSMNGLPPSSDSEA